MGRVVVVLDQSLSMPMNGLWHPGRSAAHTVVDDLRASGAPDHLEAVVGFGATARVIDADRMADLQWDFTYGSNLAGAFNLALDMLADGPGRVVAFTDLEPTAHYLPDGTPFFSYPPALATITETIRAVDRLRQAEIALEVRRYVATEVPAARRAYPAYQAIQQVADAILAADGSVLEIPAPAPMGSSEAPEEVADS